MSLSRTLASFISQTNYEDIPEDVVSFTKMCIIDWHSSALAGEQHPVIQKMDTVVREWGGNDQASLITGGKSSVTNAAFINGAAGHIVELDDIHKGSIIHAATVVIPAALAVAEWKKRTGKELITAIVIGYEVCFRIGEAVSPSHYYYWQNTATCGTFGAAVAAAKLLNLKEDQIISALGSAGTQAAGLWEFIEDGAMSKQLHPGKAAMNGVIAAHLAEQNFTAATRILEGKRGFFEAMSDEYDATRITDGLGESYKITENSFKIHASCRHTHHVIDMILELVEQEELNYIDIDKISIGTYQIAMNITDNPDPQTIYESKFSIQYCTALAAVKHKAGIDTFNEISLWDETVRSLMKKVEVYVNNDIDNAYPKKWGAKVEITLRDKQTLQLQTEFPKGDPENPVTLDEIIEKYHILTKHLSKEKTSHNIDQILKLDKIKDVSNIF
jgi:2-methylcitrate dehydratase PrpD